MGLTYKLYEAIKDNGNSSFHLEETLDAPDQHLKGRFPCLALKFLLNLAFIIDLASLLMRDTILFCAVRSRFWNLEMQFIHSILLPNQYNRMFFFAVLMYTNMCFS